MADDEHALDFAIELSYAERWVRVTCHRCEISVLMPLAEDGSLPPAVGLLAVAHSPEAHRRRNPSLER